MRTISPFSFRSNSTSEKKKHIFRFAMCHHEKDKSIVMYMYEYLLFQTQEIWEYFCGRKNFSRILKCKHLNRLCIIQILRNNSNCLDEYRQGFQAYRPRYSNRNE